MIRLVDGNNDFRRMVEAGASVRGLVQDVEISPDVVVYVWDGFSALKRRRVIYPDYKVRREAPSNDFFKSQELFQSCLLHTKAIQIRVPEYEADDVIATMAGRYEVPIYIVSTDKDLLALTHHEHVTQSREPMKECSVADIRLYKTLVGDHSDNITGIPGFGAKAWDACNKEAFLELILASRWKMDLPLEEIQETYGVKPHVAKWLQANVVLLKKMWQIIGFYDVPHDLIDSNTIAGTSDRDAVDAILKPLFQ